MPEECAEEYEAGLKYLRYLSAVQAELFVVRQIMYCNQACQKNDWKNYKLQCKSKSHLEQRLPSQITYEKLIMEWPVAAGKYLRQYT
ncbi:hypothetical protein PHLCEN_2v6180 [Hermanssonia centrifuga]|uniref:Uncharacterized protein n=1 Tax=Hermanssonia centrifuga TaxID=98765 RepID=A0A2R6P070_9APHY|nr:hypothetical protein PHLCEN_2v6180 [Hermanssonia centrifuga]